MSSGASGGVTVIVPSCNDGSRLVPTVASALAQTAPGVEVLVVDDGSTDDAPAELVQLRDPRLRVLCQPRRGIARTLNLALSLASTRWVSVLVPGDRLAPTCIARQLAEVRARPRIGAVFVHPTLVDVLGEPVEAASEASVGDATCADEELLVGLVERNSLCFAGALFDRSLARAVGGFDPSLRIALDHDLWLRLLPHCEVTQVPERLVEVATGGLSTGRADPAAASAERAYAVAKALAELCPGDWRPSLRATATPSDGARLRLELARRLLRSGLRELLGYAAELAACAQAAGIALHDDEELAPLRALHPGLTEATAAHPANDAERLAVPVARPAEVAGDAPERLRIAFEVGSLDRGGLESVVARLALGLRDRGFAPLVICTEAGGARALELRRAGIEVVVLDGADRDGVLARLLEERKIQLLNTHFSNRGAPIAARLGIPVVATLHNAYAWLGSGVFEGIRGVDRSIVGYVAVSQSVAEFTAQRFSIAPGRIAVIRNGIDLAAGQSPDERAATRLALGIPADAILIVQVGRIDPIKSQLALVAAMRALAPQYPRLLAWLVGGVGNPAYALRVEDRIRAAGLAERVVVAGERDDVPRILAAADVFVMPSVLEGLSLAAIEAMATGLPAVLTRTGDAAWLLGADASDTGVLPGALLDGPAFTRHVDSEVLNLLAERDEPEHAGRLVAALAEVIDDLPRRSERARARAAELVPLLALDRQLEAYGALFTRVAAAGGARGVRAQARVASSLAASDAERGRTTRALADSLWALARLLVENLAVRRVASSISRSRTDLTTAELEFAAALSATSQSLDKLRITHRIRIALARLAGRRPPGPAA